VSEGQVGVCFVPLYSDELRKFTLHYESIGYRESFSIFLKRIKIY